MTVSSNTIKMGKDSKKAELDVIFVRYLNCEYTPLIHGWYNQTLY